MFILFSLLLLLPGILFFLTITRNLFGKTYIISIEGNIGSGKSTLVAKLKKANPQWFFLQEPIDIWNSISDDKKSNILSKFYNDKKRYSYTFQNFAFITRISTLKSILHKISKVSSIFKNNYLIVERSIYSDKNVFAKMLYDNQDMTQLEYRIYNYWFYKLHSEMLMTGHIYLDVKPNISYNRVKKRARREENNLIPIEYLSCLNKYHDTWLNNTSVPTIVIDGNQDFEINNDQFKKINLQIKAFIENL
jgi:deoxyadenosine/deoxycytidine kinase